MKQGRLFDPQKVTSRQFEPVDFVAEGAKRFASEQGLNWKQPSNQLQVDHQRGRAQERAYRAALVSPEDHPGIKESYAAATEHINKQYDFMTRPVEQGGMGITHETVHDDPYPTPQAMADDLRQNRRIRTYATATTAAGDKQAPTLQAFDNDTNDKFRAVHDVFGHGAIGRGFSRHGEEAAYVSHKQMFPKEAHAALASETRGQNSYLNYGSESEFPNVGSRMVGMPDWASKTGKLPKSVTNAGRPGKPKSQGKQGKLF